MVGGGSGDGGCCGCHFNSAPKTITDATLT